VGQTGRSSTAPLSVSALNRLAKEVIERGVGEVLVEGEVSRPTLAASGHLYFRLKDEAAALGAVMWRDQVRHLRATVTEGLRVVVSGQVTLYAPRGDYQIVVRSLVPAGEGALRAAFLALRARLEAEGLLAEARKRPLPFLPRAVGIVTSPSAAALQDVLAMVFRRFPGMRVVLAPTRVQGPGAAAEIALALQRAARHPEVDLVILTRGGGSQEDLWAFNDEALARAIAASPKPVISAVGHEVDVTIADLVADHRALTPTRAGEMAVPELAELRSELAALSALLGQRTRRLALEARRRICELGGRQGLRLFPGLLAELRSELEQARDRARAALGRQARAAREYLYALRRALLALRPGNLLRERRAALLAVRARLDATLRLRLSAEAGALGAALRSLAALDPLAVLGRGFTLVLDESGGPARVVRGAAGLASGADLRLVFASGPDRRAVAGEELPRLFPGVMAAGFGGGTIPASDHERPEGGPAQLQGEDGRAPPPRGDPGIRGAQPRGGD
jgi:exodeoxyribonuclease VII large subunit